MSGASEAKAAVAHEVLRLDAAQTGGLAFPAQQALADVVAADRLGEPMLLSWYDAGRGIESPHGVSECGQAAPDHGVRQYARSRGGALEIELELAPDVPEQVSVFCYLDLAPALPPNG